MRYTRILGILFAGLLLGLCQPTAAALDASSSSQWELRWDGDRAVLTNRLGAEVILDANGVNQHLGPLSVRLALPSSALMDGRTVDLSGLATLPVSRDDLADGLFRFETVGAAGGLFAERSVTVLEGTDHSDSRIVLRSTGAESLELRERIALSAPDGSVLSYGTTEEPGSLSSREADGRVLEAKDGANLWFAVHDAAGVAVAGVVLSGDVQRVSLTSASDEFLLDAEFAARGQLVAAVYLLAAPVEPGSLKPLAAVESLATQDASEIGIVFIEGDRAAAIPWAGSRAQMGIEVRGGTAPLWDLTDRVDRSWVLTIQATSAQNGKPVRLLLPPGFLASNHVELTLDGLPVTPTILASGTSGLLEALLPIPHFSLRTVELKTFTPGVSPLFLGLTLLFGAVVGGESFVLARGALRSRAASRALGAGPQSQAAQRALGEVASGPGPGGTVQAAATLIAGTEREEEAKSALLRKLSVGAPPGGSLATFKYSRCKSCQAPLKFETGQATVTCGKCRALNTRYET